MNSGPVEPVLYDRNDQDLFTPGSPQLKRLDIHLGPGPEVESAPPLEDLSRANVRVRDHTKCPGNVALFVGLAPNNPEFANLDPAEYDAPCEPELGVDSAMIDLVEDGEKPDMQGIGASSASGPGSSESLPAGLPSLAPAHVNANALQTQANAALEHEASSRTAQCDTELPRKHRVDSTRDVVRQSPIDKRQRSRPHTPLIVPKQPPPEPLPTESDSIVASPNLRKHVIPVAEGAAAAKLPAMQSNPPSKDGPPSPQIEKLPSVHQITGQMNPLNELADVVTAQDPRTHTHHHSHSVGSATSQSPMLPYQSYSSAQTSPVSHYALTTRSPTSAASDHYYGSPPRYPSSAYFTQRRSSTAIDGVPHLPGSLPASLPSASSSGESQGGHTSSSADGYSTSHTTPIDGPGPADGTPRPMLPPVSGMPVIPPGFRCNFQGCTASPFQTQYLLSSHKNVHSQTRNHFCSVPGCPRAETGKGFKRKNEMIRHQLVHNSPGYICPFCPGREHKYPRPDNLQRHVKVHHLDKDRDDAELREVLAQRIEGTGKARRRRNTAASA